MLTEFEVRQRVREIRSSSIAPMRKARMLLRLGRSLNNQFRMLAHARAQVSRAADRNASAILSRMVQRTQLLHEDVREQALRALKDRPRADLN
ncbi:MAG TPA: hypothetical protein VGE01_06475 [Fimbriimonas sp.]